MSSVHSQQNPATEDIETTEKRDSNSARSNQRREAASERLAEIVAYQFDLHQVRTIFRNGQAWFVADDVCNILELSSPSNTLARLDEDERGHEQIQTGKISRQMGTVNESGLFALVLTSSKPEARKFRRWVTSEVLPAIWRTGTYNQRSATDSAIEHSDIADIINRRTGMYVVVVEGGQRRMWETDGTEIINVAIQGLSRMMAGCLIAAQGALTITQPETLLRDVDAGYALDLLGENIDRGAELARRYLTVNRFHTTESDVPPGDLAH